MAEPNLPVDIGFAPWSPQKGSATSVSSEAIQAINTAAMLELGQNITNETNLDSMYFSGKVKSSSAFSIPVKIRYHNLHGQPIW
jgi:endo-1,3(4)-beta-glucanase